MPISVRWLEPRILAALLATTLALWAFVEIADEVAEGDARDIDTTLLLSLRSPADMADPIGPDWLERAARDITALGSGTVLGFAVFVTCAFLALAGRPATALFVLLATASGAAATSLLKTLFERPRPDLVPHDVIVTTASFPSGHTMMSAVVYLTLSALIARLVSRRRLKFFVLAAAMLATGLVGISRVYLGVHWPSDVAGGWAAGAAWALGCWGVAQALGIDDGR